MKPPFWEVSPGALANLVNNRSQFATSDLITIDFIPQPTSGNNFYLVAGFDDSPIFGLLLRSTDAGSWIKIDVSNTSIGNIIGFASNGSTVVAIDDGGFIIYSTDKGLTWTDAVTPFTNNITCPATPIAYGNGIFMVSGLTGASFPYAPAGIATSPDGINWTLKTIDAGGALDQIYGIAYGNGIWVIGGHSDGGNCIQYSLDNGETWTATPSGFDGPGAGPYTPEVNAITYGVGKFLAVGDYNNILGSLAQTSADGATWATSVTHMNDGGGGGGQLAGTAFGNSTFVIAGLNNGTGDAELETSPNAASGNWTIASDLFGPAPALPYQVAFGGGLFLAVGQHDVPEIPVVKISSNGDNWSMPTIPFVGNGLLCAAFGGSG